MIRSVLVDYCTHAVNAEIQQYSTPTQIIIKCSMKIGKVDTLPQYSSQILTILFQPSNTHTHTHARMHTHTMHTHTTHAHTHTFPQVHHMNS